MIKYFKTEILIICVLITFSIFFHNYELKLNIYFSNIENSSKLFYLKQFFLNITELGDSFWYFLFSILFFPICFIINKLTNFLKPLKKYNNFLIVNSFLFISLIITGVLTQTLKHIVGKSRPNIVIEKNNFDFNYFSFDSNFHSFPSGHTSTIFVVALVLGLLIPKVKYFFYFLALAVSFSRVVGGAHYLTDVVGGIIMALVGLKITINIFKYYFNINLKNRDYSLTNDFFYSALVVLFLLAIFLTVGSSFDIFFSKLFQYKNGNFFLQNYYFNIEIFYYNRGISLAIFFRKLLLPMIVVYILIIPFFSKNFFITKLYFGHIFKLKEILFLWASSFVGLVLIVNLLLKNFWGRSRPNDVIDFGGANNFTPWYQISDACNTNCSFVSGDASVGFSIIALYFLTKKEIFFWLALFFGSCIGMIRIMEGGHFFSDVVMSAVILFLSYYFQSKYYLNKHV